MLQANIYHPIFYNVLDIDQDLKKTTQLVPAAMAWSKKDGQLTVVDRNGETYAWTAGGVEKAETSLGMLHAMAYDAYNRIVGCDRVERSIVRYHDGERTVFAEAEENQLEAVAFAIHSSGIMYTASRDGIYYVLPENLQAVQASRDDSLRPLNVCLAREEAALIFTDGGTGSVLTIDIAFDATLTRVRTLAYASEFADGPPTDIKVDERGNIYCAAPTGVHIFDPSGLRLGTILLDQRPVTICFGEANAKALFIGTEDGIYRLNVK
ncbi:SMP-30/gluconolactonase/LRE family protein [Halalkalibacter oceani]|uniref:SMP-30/gluconolactonase/LRE family protein n=1 Tax=Halalkalibacter oceani TaxID=1653776 RepID=UPI003398B6DD